MCRITENGICTYGDLPWLRQRLEPVHYLSREDIRRKMPPPAERAAECDAAVLSLEAERGKGKITDAGYDQLVCQYVPLSADRDILFRAVIRLTGFPEKDSLTGQEGCGLFFRDTMELDKKTGYPFSNMLLAGACFRGWNAFLRTGVGGEIKTVNNTIHPFDVLPGGPAEGETVEITLVRTGGSLRAGIREWTGETAVPPEIQWERDDLWEVTPAADPLRVRDRKQIFAGFLAAKGCGMEVIRDSVVLAVRENRQRSAGKRLALSSEKRKPETASAKARAAAPAGSTGTIYAAPSGRGDGRGDRDDPWDLSAAVERCSPGQTIRVLPGTYHPVSDVVLDGSGSGKLVCDGAEQGAYAVLDFRGAPHGLVIRGSGWEVSGVAVVRGMGFQIQGHRNRIRGCAAAWNQETGFLIRHPRNDAPRKEWPSGNEVSDCVSFGNMDPSEQNADGFACKVAAGEGNRFLRCRAFLNSDDGFDLFSKYRATGPVMLEECQSWMNGYRLEKDGLRETKGNGNGFKLGGSGQRVRHRALGCEAVANKLYGFTSNSNPWMYLRNCRAGNNVRENYWYSFTAPDTAAKEVRKDCIEQDLAEFDPLQWITERLGEERAWETIKKVID